MAWRDLYGESILRELQTARERGLLATELVPRALVQTGRRSEWGARAALTRLFQKGHLAKRFEFEPYRGNPMGKRTYRYWLREFGPAGAVVEATPAIDPRHGRVKTIRVGLNVPEQPVSDLEQRGG